MGGKNKEFKNIFTVITEAQSAASNLRKVKTIRKRLEKMRGVIVEEIFSNVKNHVERPSKEK